MLAEDPSKQYYYSSEPVFFNKEETINGFNTIVELHTAYTIDTKRMKVAKVHNIQDVIEFYKSKFEKHKERMLDARF
jgi:hypothetical protein